MLLVLDLDIPHGYVKTLMAGEVFNGERCDSLLRQPGTEGVPQRMGVALQQETWSKYKGLILTVMVSVVIKMWPFPRLLNACPSHTSTS